MFFLSKKTYIRLYIFLLAFYPWGGYLFFSIILELLIFNATYSKNLKNGFFNSFFIIKIYFITQMAVQNYIISIANVIFIYLCIKIHHTLFIPAFRHLRRPFPLALTLFIVRKIEPCVPLKR